jgi:hypothetical protein
MKQVGFRGELPLPLAGYGPVKPVLQQALRLVPGGR